MTILRNSTFTVDANSRSLPPQMSQGIEGPLKHLETVNTRIFNVSVCGHPSSSCGCILKRVSSHRESSRPYKNLCEFPHRSSSSMLSCTSVSPDVSFRLPLAAKQNSEHGSPCLDCPYAEARSFLSTRLKVLVFGKASLSSAAMAPSSDPHSRVLLRTRPGSGHAPCSGLIYTPSCGSFRTESLLRAES